MCHVVNSDSDEEDEYSQIIVKYAKNQQEEIQESPDKSQGNEKERKEREREGEERPEEEAIERNSAEDKMSLSEKEDAETIVNTVGLSLIK